MTDIEERTRQRRLRQAKNHEMLICYFAWKQQCDDLIGQVKSEAMTDTEKAKVFMLLDNIRDFEARIATLMEKGEITDEDMNDARYASMPLWLQEVMQSLQQVSRRRRKGGH